MPVSRSAIHPQGPVLSRFLAGAWRFQRGEETSTPTALAKFIESCLELGVTSFDHADIYGGYQVEALFGAALKEWKGDRRKLEIVTKCGIQNANAARPLNRVKHYDTSAAHIRASVDISLRNLGTDYVDVLLIHRPDPFMDAEDCARGLEDVVKAGKVRAVGVSNHEPREVALLQSRLSLPLVSNQIEFSVLKPGALFDGSLTQAQDMRSGPMIWSPLGGGALFSSQDPHVERVRGSLTQVGARLGIADIGAVALAWLLKHPSRPYPVLGSTKIARLRAAVAAEALALDRQDWFQILEAAQGKPVP